MPARCVFSLAVLVITAGTTVAQDKTDHNWWQFRGPNGSGISHTTGLPVELSPDENLIWKTVLPDGYSSPVLTDKHVFLTAYEGNDLLTICIDRVTGDTVWRRKAPRPRTEKLDHRNSPASPTPATDGKTAYVFFPDFGLISYSVDGRKQWQLPLGPFNNIYGMGASPILAGSKLILVCDQNTNSFIIAVDKNSGKVLWQTARPEAKSGHSTPVLYSPPAGGTQVIVPGSFLLTAYSVETGEKIWWVRGLSFEMKSTPVMRNDTLFINGYGSSLNQPGKQVNVPSFEETLSKQDNDGNGFLTENELPDEPASSWFGFVDLAGDKQLDKNDWYFFRAALSSLNGMLAIRLGGQGDMTEESILWQYRRAVPQLPSPLLYHDVLYMVNDGGIATSFKPATGAVIKQGRLKGALGQYYASPVAADDKIFMVSREGKVSVLTTDGSLDVVAVNDLDEACYATPAIADGRLYIRTVKALYCFGWKP